MSDRAALRDVYKLRMNPGTVHRVFQEIRFVKGLLKNEKKWLYTTQVRNEERLQGFIRIQFLRQVLSYAENELKHGYESDLSVLENDSEFS